MGQTETKEATPNMMDDYSMQSVMAQVTSAMQNAAITNAAIITERDVENKRGRTRPRDPESSIQNEDYVDSNMKVKLPKKSKINPNLGDKGPNAPGSTNNNQEYELSLKHLWDRFTRGVFRVQGQMQRIAERNAVQRHDILIPGPSDYQDVHATNGNQAGHVTRAMDYNRKIRSLSDSEKRELDFIIRHTQTVPPMLNYYYGIGGVIDKFQTTQLKKTGALFSLDFRSAVLTNDGRKIIATVKNQFIEMLKLFERGNPNHLQCVKDIIKKFIEKLNEADEETFFNFGRDGYNKIFHGQ